MDPENMWATAEKREGQNRKIKQAIRQQVELQGGQIGDTEVDFLVNIHVWHDDLEYELANFTPDELLTAITSIATGPNVKDTESDTWQEDTRQNLQTLWQGRWQERRNIETVIGPLRITKPALAEALWATLLAKCERELESDVIETPIVKVMLEVQRLVGLLSSGSYVLPVSDTKDSLIGISLECCYPLGSNTNTPPLWESVTYNSISISRAICSVSNLAYTRRLSGISSK
jgi:hypothetical protein